MRLQPAGYPDVKQHQEEVFIVVKTYPRPSVKYRELVCTAGITKSNKWIRLYPINYRYLDYNRWYKKYQWIDVEMGKNTRDKRTDSYRPNEKSIKPLAEPLSTDRDKKWLKRKKIILPTIKHSSLEEIEKEYHSKSVSLAIFKPKEIIDFIIEPDTETWSKKQQASLSQMRLFEQQPKPLEKIPFRFSYKFTCKNTQCKKPHKLSILDWETFALYRKLKEQSPYDIDLILEKIKNKWFVEMWSPKRDSYLIVGTQYPNPTFMVLGVFWPPK